MSFKVVKYADQVDEAYIRSVLHTVYAGTSYVNDFSDKFVKILLSDYQQKVRNLAWFMKDEEGRVRNYKEIIPTATKVLEEAIKNNSTIKDIVTWLDVVGATYTPEEFLANKCHIGKQVKKITKAVRDRDVSIPYIDSLNSDRTFFKSNIKISINLDDFINNFSVDGDKKELVDGTAVDKSLFNRCERIPTELGVFLKDNNEIVTFVPDQFINCEIKDNLTKLTESMLSSAFGNISAEHMKVSMDLADMLTASTGNCRSCLSVDNIHHAGTVLNFRAEFGLISFTHDANDRLYKKGRSWLYLRVTDRGELSSIPFWKQQQNYGSVSSAHQKLLNTNIEDAVKAEFDIDKDKFVSVEQSTAGPDVSPNGLAMHVGHTSAAGHVDTSGSGNSAWHILKDKKVMLTEGRFTPILLPDTLNIHGELGNTVNFTQTYGRKDYYRALEPEKLEVTCGITGNSILDCDAIKVGNMWVSREAVEGFVSNNDVAEPVEKAEPVVEEIKVAPVVMDNVDVDDF